MTKKTKRWFIIVIIISFIFTATILVAYSKGYRWQWSTASLVHTGGIFIKDNQNQVKISVNGLEQKSRTRLVLSKGALIENLIPQTYEVLIEKENYHNWYKQLQISPGLVTEAKFILLFEIQPDKKKIDVVWGNEIYNFNNQSVFYLTNQKTNNLNLKIKQFESNETEVIPFPNQFKTSNKIKILGASKNNNYIVFKQEKPTLNWFLFDLKNQKLISLSRQIKGEIEYFEFDQTNNNLYLLSNGDLFVYSVEKGTLEPFLNKKTAGFTLEPDGIFYINNASSSLEKINQAGQNQTVITFIPNLAAENMPYQIKKLNEDKFLINSTNKQLILIDVTKVTKPQESNSTVIDNNVEQFSFDKENKKIAYLKNDNNNHQLWVYYLKIFDEQPYKKTGSKELIITEKQKINKISWFEFDGNSQHLLYLSDNQIKITELDGRDRRNTAALIDEATNFFYTPNNQNILWIDTNGEFWQTQINL